MIATKERRVAAGRYSASQVSAGKGNILKLRLRLVRSPPCIGLHSPDKRNPLVTNQNSCRADNPRGNRLFPRHRRNRIQGICKSSLEASSGQRRRNGLIVFTQDRVALSRVDVNFRQVTVDVWQRQQLAVHDAKP